MKKNKTITIKVLLSKLKNKFKDLELTRRHLAYIIKDNNVPFFIIFTYLIIKIKYML